MFKLSLSRKSKTQTCDKPKNNVWVWVCGKPKKFELGLAWLISQAKLKLNIKLKLELRLTFWAWDLKKLHYQMLKSLKLRKKKNSILINNLHTSNPTYLFKLTIYIIKFIHSSLSTVSKIVQNTNFTFMLDGKELEKYLFITIMNGKILTYFITYIRWLMGKDHLWPT